jgi:hypothetical protein
MISPREKGALILARIRGRQTSLTNGDSVVRAVAKSNETGGRLKHSATGHGELTGAACRASDLLHQTNHCRVMACRGASYR